MNDVIVQRPGGGPDVTRGNKREVIYIKGDADTDGSIRITPGAADALNARFMARVAEAWNNTGIEVSGATIYLGRDLQMESAGEWVKTNEITAQQEALLPHIQFSDSRGTDLFAHIPILSPLIVDSLIQPDFSVENITSDYIFSTVNPAELLLKTVNYKTGSVAATQAVTVSFSRPPDNIFWTRDFAPSKFAANSDVKIDIVGLVDGAPGEVITTEISSPANFSLLGDSLGEAYTTADFYFVTEENAVTFETGFPLILTDEMGEVVVDSGGNIIYE